MATKKKADGKNKAKAGPYYQKGPSKNRKSEKPG
jgi:hypothetical protein